MKIEPPICKELLHKLHTNDILYDLIMLGYVYIEGVLITIRSEYDALMATVPCIVSSDIVAWFTSHEGVVVANRCQDHSILLI